MRPGDSRYTAAVLSHGTAEGWGFDSRPRHADADATGSVWIWAAERTHDAAKLIPTRARFDAVLTNPSTVSLGVCASPRPGRRRIARLAGAGVTTLFAMAPPTWIALAKATADERYRVHADREFWATTDYLYDRSEHLYYRDSRFISANATPRAARFSGGAATVGCLPDWRAFLPICRQIIRAGRVTNRCSNRWQTV